MKKREVTFYSDGVPLAGDLIIPEDYREGQKRSSIIIIRGFWATKNSELADETGSYGAGLLKEGYVIFQYDHPGFGKSGGERGKLFPMLQVAGIKDAISFVEQQPEVDKHRIGLLGSSFGGGNVIYTAGTDHRMKCVVAINPVTDGEEFLRYERGGWQWQIFLKRLDEDRAKRVLTGKSEYVDPYQDVMWVGPGEIINKTSQRRYREAGVDKLSLHSAENIINYKPIDVVCRITAPLLIIQAARDSLIPVHKTIETFNKAPDPKKLVIIEGCDHYDLFSPRPEREQSFGEAKNWFLTHLPPTPNE